MRISNSAVYLFFCSLAFIGLFIVWDFPVTVDEAIQRRHSLISAKYIAGLFSKDVHDLDLFKNLPDINSYIFRFYGVTFQLPLVVAEILLKLDPKSAGVWHLRHISVFLFFFLSCIFFYRLLLVRFNSRLWGLIGVACLVMHPRIFSNAFYNIKDIVFLSAFTISIYYSYRYLQKHSYKSMLCLLFFSALATNIRIIGLMVPYITLVFVLFYSLLERRRSSIKEVLIFFIAIPVAIWLLWPAAWADIDTVGYAFKQSKNFSVWTAKFLLAGEVVSANNLPWYYIPLWVTISTPPLYIIGTISGLVATILCFKWRFREVFDIFIFALIIIPVSTAILCGSTLYNGWKHFYFLAPLLIYFAIRGFIWLQTMIPSLVLKKVRINLLIILLCSNFIQIAIWMYNVHPNYGYYFNCLAGSNPRQKYSLGSWDTVQRQVIDYLLENYTQVRIKEDFHNSISRNLVFYSSEDRSRIKIVSSKDADFIVSFYDDNQVLFEPSPDVIIKTFGLENQPAAALMRAR